MNQSQTIGALAAALAKAQGQILGARKDAANPFFKTKYADLASVWDACRAALSQNGLAVIQTTRPTTDCLTLITTLAHASGEWISGELSMKPVKIDPQSAGSCLTYLRRYSLAAICGVAPSDSDDDGNAASQPALPQEEEAEVDYLAKLNRLTPNYETKVMLRDYLRAVANKNGVKALAPDGELADLDLGLIKYLVTNWSTVLVKVEVWWSQVPGAEVPAEEPSSWRGTKLPFAPKSHPGLKGKTIGEAFDNEDTRKWAFGMLMNYKAEPWTDPEGTEHPPSKEAIAFEAAARQWRIENGKEQPGE